VLHLIVFLYLFQNHNSGYMSHAMAIILTMVFWVKVPSF